MEIFYFENGLILWTVLSFFAFIAMLLSIYSILTNDFGYRKKLTWLIGVILLPLVGPIIYFKNKKNIINKMTAND
ncbi:PLDc N-terminal domain-containing protein [Ferruginibacter yonginensis]|uniref:PLDc N-terminal domain-containing protein n=1 Tax=Ferruginibacter yonginensis TaxID=1310416 RepID=A0ABV8QWD2_9BACT